MSAPAVPVSRGAANSKPAVLFLGDPTLADFRPAIRWLREKTNLSVSSLRNSLGEPLDATIAPDWILLGQSRDGEFSTREIAELRRRWPLARCVVAVGSWGEGEQAKQKVCLGSWRVNWHQVIARASQQLAARDSGKPGPWDRPLTSADDERGDREVPSLSGLRVSIVASDPSERDALTECLVRAGAICRSGLSADKVDAVVWRIDGGILHTYDTQAIHWLENVSRAMMVLAAFPRSSDWPQLLARREGAILGEPHSDSDLIHLLRDLTSYASR